MSDDPVPPSVPGATPSAARLRTIAPERYTEFSVLGLGGMGIVYWALDTELNRRVALKVVRPAAGSGASVTPASPGDLTPPDAATDAATPTSFSALTARFLQEAWITAGLEHPGVVPVFEVGRTDKGVPYYTMRVVRGSRTLAKAIKELEGRPVEERFELLEPFLRVCDTIRYAHAHGVVHRDLKPENVALGEFGEVVVLDWGIAKMAGTGLPDAAAEAWHRRLQELRTSSDFQTNAGALGTPGYMSPEAALGRMDEVDAKSDVYSLGAILFEVLTGQRPFVFTTYAEFAAKLLHEPAPSPHEADPRVPEELSALCVHALQRDRDARCPSVDDLAARVRAWMRDRERDAQAAALFREALAAREGLEALGGDELLRRVDRLQGLCARVLAIHPGHARAQAMADEAAKLQELAIARREGAARRKLAKRVGVGALVAASVVAAAVAWVIHGQQKQTEDALDQVRLERDATAKALAETSRALTRAEGLRLVAASSEALDRDPALALNLALEGNARHPSLVARNAALEALLDLREEKQFGEMLAVPESDLRVRHPKFDASGKRLLTNDGAKLRIWDVESGSATVLAAPAGVRLALFTDGGARAVTAGDDGIARTWDAATGALLSQCGGAALTPAQVSLSPDGRRFAVIDALRPDMAEQGLAVWDVGAAEKPLWSDRRKLAYFGSGALDPTGNRLVIDRIQAMTDILDAATGARLAGIKNASFIPIPSAATHWSPDGRVFMTSSASERTARLWDGATGELRQTLDPKEETRPIASRFSPDGKRLLTASTTARIWDVATGAELAVLRGHASTVVDVAWSDDGRFAATASSDGSARVWDAATGRVVDVLRGHAGPVLGVVFSPAGDRIATQGADGTTRLWRLGGGRASVLIQLEDSVALGAFSADGTRVVVSGYDMNARVVDVRDGRELAAFALPEAQRKMGGLMRQAAAQERAGPDNLFVARWSRDGSRLLLCGAGSFATRVLDGETWKPVYQGDSVIPHIARFSADGSRVAEITFVGKSRIVDTTTGRSAALQLPPVKTAFAQNVRGLSMSDDGGHVAAAHVEGVVWVWDAAGALVAQTAVKPGETYVVAFAPSGRRLLVSDPARGTFLWDFVAPEKRLELLPAPGCAAAAFTADGSRVALGVGGAVSIRDTADGRELAHLRGHDGVVSSVEFSADGARVVTGSDDRTARVWDASSGEELLTLRRHSGRVVATFSRDARRVLTTSEDHTARVWPLDVIDTANAARPHGLSPAERARYDVPEPK